MSWNYNNEALHNYIVEDTGRIDLHVPVLRDEAEEHGGAGRNAGRVCGAQESNEGPGDRPERLLGGLDKARSHVPPGEAAAHRAEARRPYRVGTAYINVPLVSLS